MRESSSLSGGTKLEIEMFGGIPASLILEVARASGAYTQLGLDLQCPPFYFIRPEYLCNVPDVLEYYSESGQKSGSYGVADHPSFTRLRKHLHSSGYIEMVEYGCNMDEVLKPFYLNNYLLLEGDRFLCSSALGCRKEFTENYNNGEIGLTGKNYREKLCF